MITSLLTLGSFISSLVAGVFSAYLGRKQALWLACGLNAIGVAIQMATTSKGVLYLGRLVLGLANGFFVTFSNVYTAEASPAHLRGIMVALFAYCKLPLFPAPRTTESTISNSLAQGSTSAQS